MRVNEKKELPSYRVMVDSKVLNRKVENIVLLPDNYEESRKYPVLYLLAGADNPVDMWITDTMGC
jgi:enterochelin esterase-like enzyme